MSEKIYRVQMNANGMPNFSTAVEVEDIPIYGNEHNCMMTIFGECSYAETGCGDCAVVEKVRKALSADRPQGEWIPCSERLPNEGEVVLVCMRIESHKAEWEEQRSIEFGRISSDRYDFNGTGWEWLNESGADYWQADWNNSILAWMPLPKPYEKGADDE